MNGMKMRTVCGFLACAWGGAVLGAGLARRLWRKKYRLQGMALENAMRERGTFYTWLLLCEHKADFAAYLEARGHRNIAVLGMTPAGRRLVSALEGAETVNVVCGVERNELGAVHERLPVYRLPDDALPPVDCVIVCETCDACGWQACRTALLQALPESCAVLSLYEMLQEMLEEAGVTYRDGALRDWRPLAGGER